MNKQRIRELMDELSAELERTDDLDEDARSRLAGLEEALEDRETEDESLAESVRELESRFAASHPTAERIAREIADLLSKMGI